MDVLEAHIASTCPEPFNGVTGQLFLNAVTTTIAAHCMLLNDSDWPKDNAEDVLAMANKESGVAYDFIVVGAGTAGSLVASQLSVKNPTWSILLVEAGDDPTVDSEIPAFLFLNQNSSNDWHYKTQPDDRSCLGFRDGSCIWSKGKSMGGSSSINAMIYVRGHPKDFTEWEQLGNKGWGYTNLVEYLEKQENLMNISDPNFPGYQYIWYDILDKAWEELGYVAHRYDGHEALVGTKKTRIVINKGKRLNTARMYLKQTNNITVMKNTEVDKVILNNNRVSGVKIHHSNGNVMDISANEEVILSAGSIATPQILMRSGIGPKSHLEKVGIRPIHDLPVGQNLQDHIIFPLFLRTNLQNTLPPHVFHLLLLQYMLTKSGPISNIGITDYMGFLNTLHDSDRPNIQFHYTYFPKHDNFVLRVYLEGLGYNDDIIDAIETLNQDHDFLGIYPTLLHPKSEGRVLLNETDLSKPLIMSNYLSHPDDMLSLLNAIYFVQKLQNTSTFKELNIELLHVKLPKCLQFQFNSTDYWECYIRHMATTVYHPIGTAKMGPPEDTTAVVNDQLLVHGINDLRIVDASVMPSIPGANTMAATLVIAQKAVDIISEKNKNHIRDDL